MIKFKQIVECTVEVTPAGRYAGLDRAEQTKRGLLGISESGDLYRYDYTKRNWVRQLVDVAHPEPSPSTSSTAS